LHIGDSRIWGAGVQPTDTFPARLAALEPESLHVNAGVPAIGPDGYLALARRWLPVLRPELVVVSLFAGNDLIELDSPYPCCEWGPLLAYDGPAPSLRCPTARGLESRSLALEWLRSTSPPPYLLRTTAAVSAFSAYATAAFMQPERHAPTIGEDVTLAHLGSIVAALRDESRTQGAELAVVVLPLRASLASPSPRATVGFQTGASMVDIARRQHVLVLDAWDLLEAESRARGAGRARAHTPRPSRAGVPPSARPSRARLRPARRLQPGAARRLRVRAPDPLDPERAPRAPPAAPGGVRQRGPQLGPDLTPCHRRHARGRDGMACAGRRTHRARARRGDAHAGTARTMTSCAFASAVRGAYVSSCSRSSSSRAAW